MEDAGAQTVTAWATNLSTGPANESAQALSLFRLTNNNNALFSAQPAINAATGTLTYTPAANVSGTATVSIVLKDDGGTANGGVDSTTVVTFAINVTAVNDAPSFTAGADQTVLEDSGAQTVTGWATNLSTGPANESAQALTLFRLTNNNNALFSAQPAINAATGTLTYTPAANASGTATVSVVLKDNGGTANGGVDSTAVVTFAINVTAVNDAPSFTVGADQTALEDAGAQTVTAWATNISKGPVNESAQNVSFTVTNTNNSLFSSQPAINAAGDLTYTPTVSAFGTATVSVVLKDDGGTANGGRDSTSVITFKIQVYSVPTVQASEIRFSAIQITQFKVGWTNGNGSKRAVFIKQANTGTTTPINGTTYTANTGYALGTQIGSSGWYTIYNGIDTTVTVTNLAAATNYIVQVFEYNGTAALEGYNTLIATNNPRSATTAPNCVNPTSGGTIGAAQSICNGTTPAPFTSTTAASGLTGTLEYKWQSSTISGVAGFTDNASSNSTTYAPGSLSVSTWYKRLARVSCQGNWTGAAESNVLKITVNALPTLFTVSGGGSFCSGGTGVVVGLSGSQTSVTYQLKAGPVDSGIPVAGTGAAITFGLKTAAANYTVVATNTTTSCVATMNGSAVITANPLPTLFSVSGGGPFCSGGTGVVVGLSGSQTGITYQLKVGTANSGTPVAGTGAAITFGLKTTAATYTVVATNTTSSCTAIMTGSAVITVNTLPTLFTVSGGGSFCSGGTGVVVGLSGSQTGVTYQLKAGSVNSGTPVAGTGSAITFGLQTTGATYTVVATNTTTSCTATMTGSAVVTVNALPTAYTVTGGGAYCTGTAATTTISIGVSSSQTGVRYQLLIGAVNSGTAVAGTGSAITFGLKSTAGVYTVVATNTTTGCSATMTGSATITVGSFPAAPAPIVGAKTMSEQSQLKLTDATAGGVWSSLTPTIASVSTTGTVNCIIPGVAIISYTVTNAAGCSSSVKTSFTINALPKLYSVTGGGSLCIGGTGVAVRLSLSEIGISYQLKLNGVNSGVPIVGTGLGLNFGLQTATGIYTILATNVTTGAFNTQTGSATVVVNPLPAAPAAITGTTSVCVGSLVALTDATASGIWSSSAPSIATVNTRGEVAGVVTGTTTITYTVTNASGCSSSASAVVAVNPMAAQPGAFTVSTAAVKFGTSNVIYTVPSVAGVTYNWSYSGTGATIVGTTNSVSVNFSATATSGNLSVTATNGCGTSLAQLIAVTVNSTGIKSATLTASTPPVNPVDNILTNAFKVYPNPATGPAIFEFTLGERADAKLDIYTLNGQHIARIFDGAVEAGIAYTVNYEQYLPTGVYPCILSWNGQLITIKFAVRH